MRGLVDIDLTPTLATLLGRAIGSEIIAKGGTTAAVGHDARASGPVLAEALIAGSAQPV